MNSRMFKWLCSKIFFPLRKTETAVAGSVTFYFDKSWITRFLILCEHSEVAMKSWQAEGLSLDDKYEIEEYATMMKSFADAATQGDLEQVMNTS